MTLWRVRLRAVVRAEAGTAEEAEALVRAEFEDGSLLREGFGVSAEALGPVEDHILEPDRVVQKMSARELMRRAGVG